MALSNLKNHYQALYLQQEDPWNYSYRAAEIMRHELVCRVAREQTLGVGAANGKVSVFDMGCGAGRLSVELVKQFGEIFAMDISESAILGFQAGTASVAPAPVSKAHLLVASSEKVPLRDRIFDVVILSDGLAEWKLSATAVLRTLSEAHRLLKNGGIAVFSDYLRPEEFAGWAQMISAGPLKVVHTRYLYDRLWYQFEGWFKSLRRFNWVKQILSQVWIAKCLQIPARIFGKYGSRHILLVARKEV